MIIKEERKAYAGRWGKTTYTSKQLEKSMSAHSSRGSAFSCSDSCGTCDGARCHACKEIYTVTVYSEPFYDEEYWCYATDVRKLVRFTSISEALEFYDSIIETSED